MVDKLLKVGAVAEVLGCSRTKAYDLIKSGEIPVVYVGEDMRVPPEGLHQWIANQLKGRKSSQSGSRGKRAGRGRPV